MSSSLRLTDVPGSAEWIKSVGKGVSSGTLQVLRSLSFLPRDGRVMLALAEEEAGRALQVL